MMDSLFFLLSKAYWLFAKPDALLLILLTVAFFVAWLSVKNRKPLKLMGLTVLLCWVITVLPIGNWLLYPLDSRFPKISPPDASEIAGVIVLGGAENVYRSSQQGVLQLNEMAERITEMAVLAKKYPQLPILYTSGSGAVHLQESKGADFVKAYFDQLGYSNIRYENQSRNTYENAVFSKRLLPTSEKPWLLVTSAFHMPRSVGIFTKQHISVIPYPVDFSARASKFYLSNFSLAEGLLRINIAVREWTGLIAYWFTGKTVSWFPSQADLIANE